MSPQASSRIELPISRKMWLARVSLVLALDLGLLAAGVGLILAWRARVSVEGAATPPATAARSPETPSVNAPPSHVELSRPKVLGRRKGGAKRTPVANPSAPVVPPAAGADAGSAVAPPPAVDAAAAAVVAPPPPPVPLAVDAAAVVAVDAGVAAPPAPDPEAEARAERIAEAIREHVEEGRGQIDRCYERAAKATTAGDPLRGRIEVALTILPSGDASDVHVVQNDTGSDELGACLVALLKSWKYPTPDEAIEFLWPFVFKGR